MDQQQITETDRKNKRIGERDVALHLFIIAEDLATNQENNSISLNETSSLKRQSRKKKQFLTHSFFFTSKTNSFKDGQGKIKHSQKDG